MLLTTMSSSMKNTSQGTDAGSLKNEKPLFGAFCFLEPGVVVRDWEANAVPCDSFLSGGLPPFGALTSHSSEGCPAEIVGERL
ncbi:hypothetical protein [Methylomagnum sp.]